MKWTVIVIKMLIDCNGLETLSSSLAGASVQIRNVAYHYRGFGSKNVEFLSEISRLFA